MEVDSYQRGIDVREDRLQNLELEAIRREEVVNALSAQVEQYKAVALLTQKRADEAGALRSEIVALRIEIESVRARLQTELTVRVEMASALAQADEGARGLKDEATSWQSRYYEVVNSKTWRIMWRIIAPYRWFAGKGPGRS